MVASAKLKYLVVSAQKTRLAVDPVRGKTVGDALTLLHFSHKLVTRDVEQLVKSALAHAQMVEKISAYIREQGEITVADVRDLLGTSRKYALALMDDLDHRRITRRVGDARILR